MPARFALASALAVGVVSALFVFLVARAWRKPNVVIVSLGAVRADTLDAWSRPDVFPSAEPVAPTLAHLCEVGVCFTQAYSNHPATRAAAATLLTGGLAAEHGVRGPLDGLRPTQRQLAELFASSGYDTGAVVGSYELDPIFGFRGFAEYDARFDEPIVGWGTDPVPVPSLRFFDRGWQRSARLNKLERNARKPDPMTTDSALGFAARHWARPFFLWVHYFAASPVWPAEGPPTPSVPLYVERVREADRELKRLLRGFVDLGLDRSTWFVVHGDTGFALLEHNDFGPGTSLYEPAVRVPLVVVPPRAELQKLGGRKVSTPVSLLDVAPTVVDCVGLPVQVAWRASGLGSWVGCRAESPPRGDALPLETYGLATAAASKEVRLPSGVAMRIGERWRAVRWQQWKYIVREPYPLLDIPAPAQVPPELAARLRRHEMYDLAADADERNNLAGQRPQVEQQLHAALEFVLPAEP